ncbi:MAG: formate/nitrite transporter family protein [Syntrophobacteraceae bacterium]|nr:formate/nitrite transporter family protein [Syntrophobacteraceae bacterium]
MSNGGVSIDALMPKDMAVKAENIGIAKAGLGAYRMFALAILAGAFIAMGANYATTVWSGLGKIVVSSGSETVFTTGLPYGIIRLLGGIVFATGLIMVVIGGSELFTGNCLIPMAWASKKVTTGSMLRNWVIVYIGNFVGSVLTAYLVFLGGQHTFGGGAVGVTALNIGIAKNSLGFLQCTVLAIFCNALVCMAVWMCFSARSNVDKVFVIIPPISAFVACGFEHCVANMYFIPSALFIKDLDPTFFAKVVGGLKDGGAALTWGTFLFNNLLPATIGNIIGGALMVGGMYWFIYLRPSWTGKAAMGGIPLTEQQKK